MATDSIVEKINDLITSSNAFSSEKDVVYFLVQLRKLMEREGIHKKHASVTFYCDWALHPKKTRNHKDIKGIYVSIYKECKASYNEEDDNNEDSILSLLQFKSLRNDIELVFEEYELDKKLLDEKMWTAFSKKLLGVLKDQPLVLGNEDINIKEIMITKADNNEFHIQVIFCEPITDKRGYKHGDFSYGLGYI